jgi:hypothetical protein
MVKSLIDCCSSCKSNDVWTKVCNSCGKEFCSKCGHDDYVFQVPTCPRCQSEDVINSKHKNF